MKNTAWSLIIVFTFLLSGSNVLAETNFGQNIKNTIRETVEAGVTEGLDQKTIRNEVKETVKEQVQLRKEGLLEQIKNFIKKNLRFNARVTGEIVTLENTIPGLMKINAENGPYDVNVDENTRLLRRFGGKSEISEFSVGDKVNVFGKFTNEDKLEIDAKIIRNLSIQKRWGVFFGEIIEVNSGEFVIKTIQRGDLTVDFDDETKFFNHKKEVIDSVDAKIGMRVRVKGIWDKSENEVTEVEEVRLFPVAPTKAPTVTETP